jgi:hypothetical protein
MVDRYRRLARQIAELELGGLVDLVDALGWRKGGGSAATEEGSGEDVTAEECTERDSNPHACSAAEPKCARDTQRTANDDKTRRKATHRNASKVASTGLPPPSSPSVASGGAEPAAGDVERSIDLEAVGPPLRSAAAGLAAERAAWASFDALEHKFGTEVEATFLEDEDRDVKPSKALRGPAKASARAAPAKKRRARGGRS